MTSPTECSQGWSIPGKSALCRKLYYNKDRGRGLYQPTRWVAMHEIQRTTNYRFQYNKLDLRLKRFIEEALEILKESPTEHQGRITHIANRKEGGLYRYRMPGCYLLYIVPEHVPGEPVTITLTNVIRLR